MFDVIFLVVFLLVCTAVGIAITSRCKFSGTYLAAPVVGFGIIATISTLAYRYGETSHQCTFTILAVATAGAILSARRVISDIRARPLFPFLVVILVAFLAILPKWTGGEQFYAVQINPSDQINYLQFSTAINEYTYSMIKTPPSDWGVAGNMQGFATKFIDLRPGVNIVHAAFYWPFFKTAIDGYYPYMAALQVLMSLSVAFLVLQVAPNRLSAAVVLGAIYALGPLFQHVIDLNAWGQVAGMPLAFISMGLGYLAMSTKGASVWLLVSLGASLSGILFIYPEISSIVAVCGIITAIASLAAKRDIRALFRATIPCIAAILVASLYWKGTIGFLLPQLGFASQLSRIDWAAYFDQQLFGRDVDYWPRINQGTPLTHYAHASAIIDPAMGELGLFYLLPTPNMNINVRTLLKALSAIYMAALLLSAWVSARTSTDKPLLIGLASCFAIPFYALYQGVFWTAGKALGMAAPALFIIAALPIVLPVKWFWKLPAILLALVYLSFGIARPIAATSESGSPYPPPYPNLPDKAATDWSISSKETMLRSCHGINLNIGNAFLDTFVQVALTGEALGWRTLQAIRPFNEETTVLQQPGAADCLVTDSDALPGYKTVVDLRRKN
ncbi:hypothetical protein [Rhizobium tubonense]|uniref:Glycosyltransferase RgtA/B/C/D-like domain-containing protein n=1 Tax=Rhizobium tubonense TaxID=484088 RepID=A0A2W4CRE6_9HYPH|nr:hypothetical protein [Rhizobium tubonense]PZM14871.1 hypothetical protein CPY51_09245 [Rhizobium tubonense]